MTSLLPSKETVLQWKVVIFLAGCFDHTVRFFGKTPFFGRNFWMAGARAHKMALAELFFVVIFSTLPIWLRGIVLISFNDEYPATLNGLYLTCVELFQRGELFLYCIAIFVTVGWLNLKYAIDSNENDGLPKDMGNAPDATQSVRLKKGVCPPNMYFFLVVGGIGMFVSVAFYVLNVSKANLDVGVLFQFSAWIYLISLILYHNALVSDYAGFKDYSLTVSEKTKAFADDYAKHRGVTQ